MGARKPAKKRPVQGEFEPSDGFAARLTVWVEENDATSQAPPKQREDEPADSYAVRLDRWLTDHAGKHKREPVSPKVRFEVFKRDKFTCQYCGGKAPEVVLKCDHMRPVAAGGSSDILSLITSCHDCNSGKGAVPLSQSTEVSKQHAHMAQLEERRQQLEMLMQWRDELQGLASDIVARIAGLINQRGRPWAVNDNGLSSIRKWLKRYSAQEIISAIDASFDQYATFDSSGAVNSDSWSKAFKKIPAIIAVERDSVKKPYLKKLFYIQAVLRNRSKYDRLSVLDYLEHLHLAGADMDAVEGIAKRAVEVSDFYGPCDAFLKKVGKPF